MKLYAMKAYGSWGEASHSEVVSVTFRLIPENAVSGTREQKFGWASAPIWASPWVEYRFAGEAVRSAVTTATLLSYGTCPRTLTPLLLRRVPRYGLVCSHKCPLPQEGGYVSQSFKTLRILVHAFIHTVHKSLLVSEFCVLCSNAVGGHSAE
jgi:hypothetical protein